MSDTSTVYIFKTWEVQPTYHDYGRIKELDIARSGDVTKCGLVMYDGAVQYRAMLRRDHADLFAKPCAKCFAASSVAGSSADPPGSAIPDQLGVVGGLAPAPTSPAQPPWSSSADRKETEHGV